MEEQSTDVEKMSQRLEMLSAVFPGRENVEAVCYALHKKGYSDKEISVIMSETVHDKHFTEGSHLGAEVIKGSIKGTTIGSIAGAIAGAISAIGTTIALPGLGIMVAGPLAIGLAGALAGGATGGLTGAMIGAGFAEERVRIYEPQIKSGNIVITVHPHSVPDADYIVQLFRDNEGRHIYR